MDRNIEGDFQICISVPLKFVELLECRVFYFPSTERVKQKK